MANPFIILSTLSTYTLCISLLMHNVIAVFPRCWDYEAGAPTLIYKECLDIINQQVIRGRDLNVPLRFSQDDRLEPDISLPASWSRTTSNCFVGLDFTPGRTGSDRASMLDIRRAAQAIAIECVIKGPQRGGYAQFGWYDKLYLTLIHNERQGIRRNETLSTE